MGPRAFGSHQTHPHPFGDYRMVTRQLFDLVTADEKAPATVRSHRRQWQGP